MQRLAYIVQLLVCVAVAQPRFGDEPMMMIEFEGGAGGGPSDQDLMQLLDMLGPPPRGMQQSQPRMMMSGGGGGPPPMMFLEEDPAMMMGPFGPKSSMPVDQFHGLFPGPLMFDGGRPGEVASMQFGGPDPLVMDMMDDFGMDFQEHLLPAMHGGSSAPTSCNNDLQKHCSTARSQVHCLGQHKEDISASCRKDVGMSVPFLCSESIDKFCDVLEKGLLSCLGEHTKDLGPACKDAFAATSKVIAKASTNNATVVNAKTGEKKAQAKGPSASGSPMDKAKQAGFLGSLAIPTLGATDSGGSRLRWSVVGVLFLGAVAYGLAANGGTSQFKPNFLRERRGEPLIPLKSVDETLEAVRRLQPMGA